MVSEPETGFPNVMGGQQWMAMRGHLGSAYGTEHPIDVALGNWRRVKSFHHATRAGAMSNSQMLHAARAQIHPMAGW